MSLPDLNLLITLDVLLTEGSVARAARRLQLSPSAMSRALARLRDATGDPLLVRTGRALVPTPRATELRERVRGVVQEAQALLRPTEALKLDQLERTFSLRTGEGFVENFGAALIARVAAEAPAVRLCFLQKPDRESDALRGGVVDLETGVVSKSAAPELRVRTLFRDRFIGVARSGHVLSATSVTPASYAAGRHIGVLRGGADKRLDHGPIDAALAAVGLQREIATSVGGFASALALARASDLIATVPEWHTGVLRTGMHSFALPFATPSITVSMLWHPRQDADPAHRWFRGLIAEVCAPE